MKPPTSIVNQFPFQIGKLKLQLSTQGIALLVFMLDSMGNWLMNMYTFGYAATSELDGAMVALIFTVIRLSGMTSLILGGMAFQNPKRWFVATVIVRTCLLIGLAIWTQIHGPDLQATLLVLFLKNSLAGSDAGIYTELLSDSCPEKSEANFRKRQTILSYSVVLAALLYIPFLLTSSSAIILFDVISYIALLTLVYKTNFGTQELQKTVLLKLSDLRAALIANPVSRSVLGLAAMECMLHTFVFNRSYSWFDAHFGDYGVAYLYASIGLAFGIGNFLFKKTIFPPISRQVLVSIYLGLNLISVVEQVPFVAVSFLANTLHGFVITQAVSKYFGNLRSEHHTVMSNFYTAQYLVMSLIATNLSKYLDEWPLTFTTAVCLIGYFVVQRPSEKAKLQPT